jgi:hypothetical protein
MLSVPPSARGVYSIYTVQAGQWAYFQQVSI